ncbi:MAG TPA: sigma-70 family RNA polymerase sigma factor [Candidatus Dormibacteraeota bacterium]|nr:sigma-70 family RNA polymerase sigma factor [Candidatus Dormibacteraeota bacterium]
MAHIEAGWPEGTDFDPEPPAEQQATGAMRSWLVHGTRKFAIDQRRRFGRHGESRRLLAADGAKTSSARGTWQDLVAALQRQAVHGALAQLRTTDRQILTLAYLQGHTNREIAARLGVSVRTVSRRLAAALARLDEYVRQAGIWMASVAVVGIAHFRAARWPGGATTAAAATAAVVALGVVAVGTDNTLEPRQTVHRPPATKSIVVAPWAPETMLRASSQPAAPVVQHHSGSTSAGRSDSAGHHGLRHGPKSEQAASAAGESAGETQGESQAQGPH